MCADRIRIYCHGDKKIPNKLKYFFNEDMYELSDVKLDERINLLRIHLSYVFYNNPISEYFKNEGNFLSERPLIYIYFLCLNNLEEYRNEKEYILSRYKDSINDENDECIIIYAYNLDDNVNEIKNIKKIKSDFSHNSYKSIKILSLPILNNEDYYYSNNKIKELYEHFKIRYMDHLKICIVKRYHMIKSGYTKSMTNFLNFVEHSKKTLAGEKKKNKNDKKSKFHITDIRDEPSNEQEENKILEFVDFYKNHNVFLFCNEFVDINFFLKKNDLCTYINELEFVTDYDEELYVEMYDQFLLLFIWCENMCLLFSKLNLFKKSYTHYSTVAKLFMKYLKVFVKKKKCIIHSSILFEKNYHTIASHIREKNICSIHLLEYIFFKKFTILLLLNKYAYISSKALKFAKFFYTNKLFIIMHNFTRFKNSVIRNSTQLNFLKNIQKKIAKYRKKDIMNRAVANSFRASMLHQNDHNTEEEQMVNHNHQFDKNHKDSIIQHIDLQEMNRDAIPRGDLPTNDKNVVQNVDKNVIKNVDKHAVQNVDKSINKNKKSLISEFKDVFRKGADSTLIAIRNVNLIKPEEGTTTYEQLEKETPVVDANTYNYPYNDPDDYLMDNLQEDDLENSKLLSEAPTNESPTKTPSNDQSIQERRKIRGDLLVEFPNAKDKIMFLLKCCFMNKENFFAIYLYNLGNLIKFLFERRSSFYYEEELNKNKSEKSVHKNNTNISKYLSLQKNIMKLGYQKNFGKKKKSKKSLKIKTKRSNSLDDSSTSQISSTSSERSEGKNNYSFHLNLQNDFCINVTNIFKLAFMILKNILNSYKTDLLYNKRNVKKTYLFNFFLDYLEEKQFEKNIQKEDIQQVKNVKKNVYQSFPIYHIKNFLKGNEKRKINLLINIMNKITNLCHRKYYNISIINKFFLAVILFENSKYKKSFKILKKIIQKSNNEFLIFFCMQLISFHNVNNKFYHFCCSFFLSNKHTPILSFKDINVNFTTFANHQYYLFFRNSSNSLLRIQHKKHHTHDFYSVLNKDIVISYRSVVHHVLQSVFSCEEPFVENVEMYSFFHNKGIREEEEKCAKGENVQKSENCQNSENFQKSENCQNSENFQKSEKSENCEHTGEQRVDKTTKDRHREPSVATISKNKLIKFKAKQFCKSNYYFEPNEGFLKSLRRFNFSVCKNEEQGEMYIPESDIKVFVQSNYNLYLFISSMNFGIFGKDEEDQDHDREKEMNKNNVGNVDKENNQVHYTTPSQMEHIGTLLRLRIQEYTQKKGKEHGEINRCRVRELCVQYDENIDLFVFSALSENLQIDSIIIQLYEEKENKKIYIKFAKEKYIIKEGLNLIKLNVSSVLESNQINWKYFYYRINYVYLQINHFSLYQQMGILPSRNILTSFLSVYSNFINSNYTLLDCKKYTTFFLNQLISPLYIKIKILHSILSCKMVASYLNSTSLVYDSTNYIKLIVSNNHWNMDLKKHNELISTERKKASLNKTNQEKASKNELLNRVIQPNSNKSAEELKFTTDMNEQIKNIHIFVHTENQNIDLKYESEICTLTDSVFFFIEKNDHIQITEPKVLIEEETCFNLREERNEYSFKREEDTYHDSCSYDQRDKKEKDEKPYAVISFVPVKTNCCKMVNHKLCQNVSEISNNTHRSDIYDTFPSNCCLHSTNDMNKVKIKCVLNIKLGEKKRKQRRTDLYKLSDVNYVGQMKFDKFINLEKKNSSCILPLNNQIIIEKTFHLVNIFKEKINTYRSNNTVLYELNLKLHKDNYSLFLKKCHISISNKHITHIKRVKIFPPNIHNVEYKPIHILNNDQNYFNDMSQLQSYTLSKRKQGMEPPTGENQKDDSIQEVTKEKMEKKLHEENLEMTKEKMEKKLHEENLEMTKEKMEKKLHEENLEMTKEKMEKRENNPLVPKSDRSNESNIRKEVNYFNDEIDINSYIHGGTCIFLLFQVVYEDTLDDNDDEEKNSTNLLNYESVTGKVSITYEYRNLFIMSTFARKQKKHLYSFDVFIPKFLLPIFVYYEIPKYGMIHTTINVKIVLSNNMREDIYMKYFVCLEKKHKIKNNNHDDNNNNGNNSNNNNSNNNNSNNNNSNNNNVECNDAYNWLINGFKKRVLFLPTNSSHTINLTVIPLKIGLINFPQIMYYVKLNDKWVEITQILEKSENFQVIISPPLHFSPKMWQLV
ncbi:hypothetical protein, conserved [Plasmodium gonderi]|uniref:Uncharacterized protein n=1 Tax=Plasmodium gonderi TaxID=77519 RepID=A0A1Y1JF48_PLAGO|nr:hypothetical protein, conserved [Plasmodium gonderi]GAW81161.1 hypothetical protein, conserved [Plasmodium gonderi]